jgi:hypothetical protein
LSAAGQATSYLHFCCLLSTVITFSHLLPSPFLIRHRNLLSPLVSHCCPISWLIVKSEHWSSPLVCRWANHLLLSLLLPLAHRRHPLSSAAIALSHPPLPSLICSCLLPLPYLVADCQVGPLVITTHLPPSGPHLASAFVASFPPPLPSLIRRCHHLSPLVYRRSPILWLIVKSDHCLSPLICHRAGHLLLPLLLPLFHHQCPLSSAIATSCLLLSAAIALSLG